MADKNPVSVFLSDCIAAGSRTAMRHDTNGKSIFKPGSALQANPKGKKELEKAFIGKIRKPVIIMQ